MRNGVKRAVLLVLLLVGEVAVRTWVAQSVGASESGSMQCSVCSV
jgi:hypothetical protein